MSCAWKEIAQGLGGLSARRQSRRMADWGGGAGGRRGGAGRGEEGLTATGINPSPVGGGCCVCVLGWSGVEGRGWTGAEDEGAGRAVLGKVEGALCRPSGPEPRPGGGNPGVGKREGKALRDQFGSW